MPDHQKKGGGVMLRTKLREQLKQYEEALASLSEEEEAQVLELVQKTMQAEEIPKDFGFDPRRTALFTSFENQTCINCFNEKKYRCKIALDAMWLLTHGYQNLIVDYGTDYGHLAMRLLLNLQETRDFAIFALRKRGRMTVRKRDWNQYQPLFLYADHVYGFCDSEEYQEMIGRVSAVSSTKKLLLARRWIPQWLYCEWQESTLIVPAQELV